MKSKEKNEQKAKQNVINKPIIFIEFNGNTRNIESLTVIELKAILKKRKLHHYGNKELLLTTLAQV